MSPPLDPTPACPPEDILEILAAGGSTDDTTRTHTDTCPRCQSLLEELRSHAAFVAEYLEDVRPKATGLTGAGHPHAAADTELDVSPDLVPGYRILAPIHRGGQGVVYRALHEKTKRTVAIKMLLAGHFADARQRQRFEREAELAALLKHPNLVTIYDTLNLRGGRYAIVMEYIEGSPLDQWKPSGATDRERIRATIRLFVEICSGLQHAHSNAIIHRDLKPSNVLVDKEGRARIVDFGIARSLKPDDAAITHTGEFTGTRQFASPEQIGEAMGKPARSDARSDVYSLGVMLFAVLCGRLPYDVGDSIFSSAEAILNATPARPTSIRAAIGKDLETIILKALQKEPDRRYETAISLGRDLDRYLGGEAIEARRDSTWYVVRKALRRNRVPLGIAGAVAIATTWVAVRESGLRQLADDNAAQAKASAEEALKNQATAERQRTRAELAAAANQALNEDFFLGEVQNIADSSDPARTEEIVWHLFLKRTFDALDPSTNDNRKAAALWWMRELHRRQPCLFTKAFSEHGPLVGAVSPADSTLTVCDAAGTISRLNVPSGAVLASSNAPPPSPGDSRSLSPDGRLLAIDNSGVLSVFDVEAGKFLALPAVHPKLGGPPAFLPDSRILFVEAADRLAVLDPRRGTVVPGPSLPKPVSFVDARWSPAAVTDIGGVTRFWNGSSTDWTETIDLSTRIPALDGSPSLKVCPAPDRSVLAALRGANIYLLDRAASRSLALLHSRTSRPVVAFLPGSDRFLLSGRGSTICVCSAADARTLESLVTHANGASVLGATPDGRYIATGDASGRLKLWDLRGDPWRTELRGHAQAVLSIRFSDEAHLTSCAGDGRIIAWNLKEPASPASTRLISVENTGAPATLSSLAIAPGGSPVFIAGYDHSIRRLSGMSDADTPVSADLRTRLFCLALSPDSTKLAAACDDGDIAILDASTLQTVHRWHAHEGRVTWVSWSPNGDRLASASTDRTVIAWDTQQFNPIEKPYAHPAEARGAAFSGDGQFLYSVSDDGALRLREILGKRPVAERSRHDDMIYALAASPRSKLVATGGREGVILWYGPQLAYLANLELPADAAVFALDFSPDGSKLAAGTQSGTVYVWDFARFDHAIASNLEHHVSRLQKLKRIDEPTAAAARAWAAKVLASDTPVEPAAFLPAPLSTTPVPPPASPPTP